MFFGWDEVDKSQALDLLKGLKLLFSNPDNWIYFPDAVNSSGLEVAPLSPEAVKWSLMGACDKILVAKYQEPLSSFISCATREYLNSFTDDKLIKGEFSYDDEFALINLVIEKLELEISKEN